MKYFLQIAFALSVFFSMTLAEAQNKVVVVPLGGAPGNAVPNDVVKGKTFSSEAGKGLTGTLELKAGEIFTNSIGMQFRLIPAGSFVMGSPNGTGDASHPPVWPAELGRDSDERQHIVSITKPFYMQTTEVTQGQWLEVMGSNPSNFKACGSDCPVDSVSWEDAQVFIESLNALEGRTNCGSAPNTCYSLPTEAQWEYAARGGTLSAYHNGEITYTDCSIDPNLDAIGWYCGNSGATTHPVAQKGPNNWGLYDMSGNVWEWCKDYAGTYPDGPVTDPLMTSGSLRIARGGCWLYGALCSRLANRGDWVQSADYYFHGFRVVLPAAR